MLSRSSWRAALVLRAARSNVGLANNAAAAGCTCFQERHRRASSQASLVQEQYVEARVTSSPSGLKITDSKGKGREEQQIEKNGATTDDHPQKLHSFSSSSSSILSTPSAASASASVDATNAQDYATIEARLAQTLQKPYMHQARDSWKNFLELPLDARNEQRIPTVLLSHLANAQKTLGQKRRGLLWPRLHKIYAAWQRPDSPIPQAEIEDTLLRMQEWAQTRDPERDDLQFKRAQSLCLYLTGLLDPFNQVTAIEKIVDFLLDCGSSGTIARFVKVLSARIKCNASESEQIESTAIDHLGELCTRLISALAQRAKVRTALDLVSTCHQAGLNFDEVQCKRDLTVAILATNQELTSEQPRLDEVQQNLDQYQRQHAEGSFFQSLQEAVSHLLERLQSRQDGQTNINDVINLLNEAEPSVNTLSLLKYEVQRLLHSQDLNTAQLEDSVLARDMQNDALRCVELYEEYLSNGCIPDAELHRLVRTTKRRLETISNFSAPLREAALRHASTQRRTETQNPKYKWQPAREITAHDEVANDNATVSLETGEAEPSILAQASLVETLHLAMEVHDLEVARATVPLLLKQGQLHWSIEDGRRPLEVLNVLTRAALEPHTPESRHPAVQLACDFYTSWQADFARELASNKNICETAAEAGLPDPMKLRTPSTNILRILRHNHNELSFSKTFFALINDPRARLTRERMKYLARLLIGAGMSPWTAMKIYNVKSLLQQNAMHAALLTIFTQAIETSSKLAIEQRIQLEWCERILALMQDFPVSFESSTLVQVLQAYEGRLEPNGDSVVHEIVERMREENIVKCTDHEMFLRTARLHLRKYANLEATLLSLQRGSAEDAITMIRELAEAVYAENRPEDARLLWNLVRTSSLQLNEAQHADLDQLQAVLSAKFAHGETEDVTNATLQASRSPADSLHSTSDTVASVKTVQGVTTPTAVHWTSSEVEQPVIERLPAIEATQSTESSLQPSFLSAFFTHNEPSEVTVPNSEVETMIKPALGFQEAVGPGHDVSQAAAAAETFEAETIRSHTRQPSGLTDDQQSDQQQQVAQYNTSRVSNSSIAIPPAPVPSQAYSTLAPATQRTLDYPAALSQSLLYDLSRLPQQFADMTLEQVLAWKKRCEIELQAVKRREEEMQAARRIAVSRADASRWQGWQEFQATPWY